MAKAFGITYSHSHPRVGIGACFLMMTHARLRRSPSSASNSARPTVTVRPSGRGTGAAGSIDGRDRVAFRGYTRGRRDDSPLGVIRHLGSNHGTAAIPIAPAHLRPGRERRRRTSEPQRGRSMQRREWIVRTDPRPGPWIFRSD